MTCPTSHSQENCNQCLLNTDCSDCSTSCFGSSNVCDSERTYPITIEDIDISDSTVQVQNIPTGNICAESSTHTNNHISLKGPDPSTTWSAYAPVEANDSLVLNNLTLNNNTLGFSLNYTDTDPTVATNLDKKFKTTLNLKIAENEDRPAFEFIQDYYREPFAQITEFLSNNNIEELDVNFHSFLNEDPDQLARNLFTIAKNSLLLANINASSNTANSREETNELNRVRREIDDNRTILNDIKNLNSTAKREIEININKSRKFANTNRVLMIVLILVALLIVFPILKTVKILDLQSSIIAWCSILLLVLCYMGYELYVKEINRDKLEFNRYNFAKPTDEEIAKSRALAQMSDKDKARCQAFAELEEELDVPNINLNIDEYRSRETPEQPDRCSHLNN